MARLIKGITKNPNLGLIAGLTQNRLPGLLDGVFNQSAGLLALMTSCTQSRSITVFTMVGSR